MIFALPLIMTSDLFPQVNSLLLLELGATSPTGSLQINVEMVVRVA